MRCKQARKRLRLMSGPEEWQADPDLQAHLKECVPCSDHGQEILRTWEALGQYPSVRPSPDFIRTFNLRLADQEPRNRIPSFAGPIPGWQWMALAASVLLVILLAVKPPQPAADLKAGLSNTDVTDENFLQDLDRSLESSEGNYLPTYDSWPATELENSPESSPESQPGSNSKQKGAVRHEGA